MGWYSDIARDISKIPPAVQYFEDELDIVNGKIKHLIVFSSELANILLPKDAELPQTLQKKEEIA